MGFEITTLNKYIEIELNCISNEQVLRHIRGLLVQPKPILLNWDYGEVGQQFLCWVVLEEALGKCGIAYCNEGFGPKNPWGIVTLEENSSIGMDTNWYPTFMQTYIGRTASEIPIWCIFKEEANGLRRAITSEGEWDKTWGQAMALREADPEGRYRVETKILRKSK